MGSPLSTSTQAKGPILFSLTHAAGTVIYLTDTTIISLQYVCCDPSGGLFLVAVTGGWLLALKLNGQVMRRQEQKSRHSSVGVWMVIQFLGLTTLTTENLLCLPELLLTVLGVLRTSLMNATEWSWKMEFMLTLSHQRHLLFHLV